MCKDLTSVIMTDMKSKAAAKKSAPSPVPVRDTFSVRDMNRQPQAVLTAARTLGRVHIQGRSGERFVIQPEPAQPMESSSREDFRARVRKLHSQMRATGSEGFTEEGWQAFGKQIAGEG